jgi:glycosyltransferase involved in cell wall biosynthesis
LRITFLLTQSLESPSGLGRYWPLSRELVRLGHEVTILALHHDFRAVAQRCFVKDGVRICYLGQMHVRKTGNRKDYFSPTRLIWIAAVDTWRLTRAASRVSADVIHLAKPHPMNGIAGWVARWLRGRPLYLDCDDYEAESNRFSGMWQRQVVALFEDRLPSIATGITVNTRFITERLKQLGYPSERIVYVPNGVDRQRFSNTDKSGAEALRQYLGLNDQKVVLYIGSLSLVSHAVDLLIEAFAIIRSVEPRALLLLVGGGEDYELLQSQADASGLSDGIRFAGRVSPDEVPLYYLLARASVDPARNTPAAQARSPLKLFESWAMGVPCVTTDVGDRRELLGDPPAGFLATPGDIESLADAINRVLQSPDLHEMLRRRGLERVQSFYWEKLVKDFVRIYHDT